MKKSITILFYLYLWSILYSQTPKEILEIVDQNQRNFSSLYFSAEITIYSSTSNTHKSFFGFIQASNTFIEYNNIEDLGFRYLKIENRIWSYSPETKTISELPKELFKHSIKNTDLSYRDQMNKTSYSNDYIADSFKSVIINDVEMLILKLKPKYTSESYYIEKELFITKKDYLIQKIVSYTKTNDKLTATKEFIFKDYREISNFKTAMTITVKDLNKKNSSTIIKFKNIKINEPIDKKIFTLEFLKD